MSKPQSRLASSARSCSVLAAAMILPFAIGAVPAQAQGIFGLFRAFSQPTAPAPAPQPLGYQLDPGSERPRRKARPRPKPVAVEQPEVRKPIEPKPMGEIDNPVPALLADSTLRRGDKGVFDTPSEREDEARCKLQAIIKSGGRMSTFVSISPTVPLIPISLLVVDSVTGTIASMS